MFMARRFLMSCHSPSRLVRTLPLLEVDGPHYLYFYWLFFISGSGSGKSTIIRLLYRFFEPSSGNIQIGDQNITAVDMDSLRKAIAIVPQDSVLFHNTIKHNIAYGNLAAADDQVYRWSNIASRWTPRPSLKTVLVPELRRWLSCTTLSRPGPVATSLRWGREDLNCLAGRSRGWP